MKIENKENVKGTIKTVVSFENEKYVRFQKYKFTGLDMKPVIQWRKCRTNHLVNAEKHKQLEDMFSSVDTTTRPIQHFNELNPIPGIHTTLTSSGGTAFFNFMKPAGKTDDEKEIDAKIIELCKTNQKLVAIRLYKEKAGFGLKESKDYVESLYDTYVAEKKWNDAMLLTNAHKQKEKVALRNFNERFKNNSEREKFIDEVKRYFKDTGPNQTLQYIKERKGAKKIEAQAFFDIIFPAHNKR